MHMKTGAIFLSALVLAAAWSCAALSSRSLAAAKPTNAPVEITDPGATILLVINDSPITSYNIDQRVKLLSLDGSGGWQQRLQAKLKAPDLQQRFKAFALAHNPKSKEEVLALQKLFVDGLRQQAVAEGRPGMRDKAVSQLISETLELQEAKRQSVLATDEELNGAVTDIAKRNKKTQKEFEAAIAATGVSPRAFRERIRAQMSWQRVLAARFRGQIVVAKSELDLELATDAGNPAADASPAELKLQRIIIPLKGSDAASSVAGYAAADDLRQRVKPCNNMSELAKSSSGARFEDLGVLKPDSLGAEVRPILSSATAGSVPPPILTKSGIEIYGVCERTTGDQGEAAKTAARDKIEREKLNARSRGLISDLCAAASIEPRNGFKLAKPCGIE